jgi:hypothetical protein
MAEENSERGGGGSSRGRARSGSKRGSPGRGTAGSGASGRASGGKRSGSGAARSGTRGGVPRGATRASAKEQTSAPRAAPRSAGSASDRAGERPPWPAAEGLAEEGRETEPPDRTASSAGADPLRSSPGPDPLRGPDDSPWVRYERLREEVGSGSARNGPALPDLSALLLAIEGLRGLIPRELSEQFTALVRELLLTLRALIDWYLGRLEGGHGEPEVEEIPIE